MRVVNQRQSTHQENFMTCCHRLTLRLLPLAALLAIGIGTAHATDVTG
ncbi:MAG: hypothetical protein JSS03_07290, partial [Proteobacteria bacterium]|nr:hypothetical protein [Pseudomonadota bacterium]